MDLNNVKGKLRNRFLKQNTKNKTRIGLDWGFSSLKVVILELQNDTYLLKDARIVEFPSQDSKLGPLIKDLDFSDGVNLGICGPNVVVRYMAMAKMSENDFRNSLRYEAAQHLPFPVEEVNLDGAILKELPNNQMLVMLVAARKDFINQRLKVFQEAGIDVRILDIDSLALINAFNYNCIHKAPKEDAKEKDASSGAVALLNIGASVTNINVLEQGIPHFSRDINVAGRDFVSDSFREVSIANFVSEISKSFDYYETGSTAVINKIFLSGGGSLSAGLDANLNNLLGIKIEKWDPFGIFKFVPGLDEPNIRKNAAQFGVAVGLALR
ncbi:MAG: pilus assembly protein PilM [Candidatus Omnitrophota bacterium]